MEHGGPISITCSSLSFLVMASGPDSSGLAGSLGADARRCEGRLFLGSAPSPRLRSSDGEGWHRAREERDSRQQGLQTGGSCWDLVSSEPACRHGVPAPTHTGMCVSPPPPLSLTHMHTHTLQHPAHSYIDSWQSSVYHPRQKASTCWAVGCTVPGSRKVCTATRSEGPLQNLVPGSPLFLQVLGPEGSGSLCLLSISSSSPRGRRLFSEVKIPSLSVNHASLNPRPCQKYSLCRMK